MWHISKIGSKAKKSEKGLTKSGFSNGMFADALQFVQQQYVAKGARRGGKEKEANYIEAMVYNRCYRYTAYLLLYQYFMSTNIYIFRFL